MKKFILSFLILLSQQLLAYEEFLSSVVVEILRQDKIFTCSGIFISRDKILTSAHCLDGEVSKVRIFPQNKYSSENPFLKIKSFQLHPDYDSSTSNFYADIAIIHLDKAYLEELRIAPIYCAKKIHGDYVRIGYGRRLGLNQRTSLPLNLKSNFYSKSFVEFFETDSQSGDSGGPIFIVDDKEISLLAIHSTLSFGPLGKYSFNPKVCSFKKWIDEN